MKSRALTWVLYVLALLGLAVLVSILLALAQAGIPRISWQFFTEAPRQTARGGGIGPELFNTLYMVLGAMAISVPIGLAAAILRVEYRPGSRWATLVEESAQLLATLPSVVVGLALFVLLISQWHWPFSRLSGGLALAFINIPWAAQSAMTVLRSVPDTLREASLALGATRFQTVTRVVLPRSWPGLVSGLGLGGARLLGESAALIYTAGVNVSPHAGWNIWAPGETLAVHLWYVRTEGLMPDANGVAAATGLVLLGLLGAMLAVGFGIASWLSRRAGVR